MNKKAGLIVAVVVGVVVLVSVLLSAGPAHQPPVIASVEVAAERVSPSESTEIVCTASSPDADGLTYEWAASAGEITGTGAYVIWTAPDQEGDYTVSVIVSDKRGATATESVTINVTANRPPEIGSLTADAEWAVPDGSIMVSCNASDPDGDELTYDWTQSDGHVIGSGPEVTWIAPEDYGVYEIAVAVDDGYGGSVAKAVSVKVMPGRLPDIEGLEITKDAHGHCYLIDGTMPRVGRAQKYDIECLVSNMVPGTDIELFYELFFEWEWEDGEAEGEGRMITWTAPNTSRYVTVTVTVSDIAGNTASESMTLNVVGCSSCTFRGCP